jgi:hypothetical protein
MALYFCDNAEAGIAALARIKDELRRVPVKLYVVTSQHLTKLPEDIGVLYDDEGKGKAAYNAGAQTLYLVRPDRHIAARRFVSDASELPVLLSRAIGGRIDAVVT